VIAVVAIALGLFVLLLTAKLWLPLISLIVPDRYVMAYAPDNIQKMVFEIDTSEEIPTPEMANPDAASELFSSLEATNTPTPQPAVAAENAGSEAGYLQPTPVAVAPTPTLTPVFSYSVDPRAEDSENSADLSQASHLLTGFTWEQQGYNNCGPASIKVLMSYWGVDFTEEEAADFLKPNQEDPNVRPEELGAYVEQYGYQVLIRVGGNIELLKQLILAGYPVLIETGYDPEPTTIGWTSHYLTLAGYSDVDQEFIAMDTYRRPNWAYPYHEIDRFWRQFNRRYLVVHRPDQTAAVASIIGENMDDTTMYTNTLYTAQFELSLDRSDPYGWFNLGSSLVGLGRYEEAATAFDQARQLGLPSRFLWYQFTPFEAYLQVGRNDDVIDLANDVLAAKPTEEALYYRGLAYAAEGDVSAARRQLSQALRYNRNYESAQLALDALGDS
jgi:tetratricopeptide (TPR) repeat protein